MAVVDQLSQPVQNYDLVELSEVQYCTKTFENMKQKSLSNQRRSKIGSYSTQEKSEFLNQNVSQDEEKIKVL